MTVEFTEEEILLLIHAVRDRADRCEKLAVETVGSQHADYWDEQMTEADKLRAKLVATVNLKGTVR